jgi:hypothetical protein
MRRVALIVLLSIAVSAGDDKDKTRFAPGPAESYPNHQTVDKITIAAVPYVTEAQAHAAFDKANPNKYGVLPILVVIANATGKALRLDLQAEFIEPDGKHLDATPALDVTFIGGSKKVPRIPGSSGAPFPLPRRTKGGPLDTLEITGRAFAAKLLPAGESVNGFFYFQTDPKPGTKLYLTGIKDAATGQDYFYYEIPL